MHKLAMRSRLAKEKRETKKTREKEAEETTMWHCDYTYIWGLMLVSPAILNEVLGLQGKEG